METNNIACIELRKYLTTTTPVIRVNIEYTWIAQLGSNIGTHYFAGLVVLFKIGWVWRMGQKRLEIYDDWL